MKPASSARRDPAKIAAEIVRAASRDTSKTGMMYAARLNYKQLKRYLAHLVREGMVVPDQGAGTYSSTARGRAFLNAYDELETLTEAVQEKQRTVTTLFRVDLEETEVELPAMRVP